MTASESHPRTPLRGDLDFETAQRKVAVLMEEYKALYGLVTFRMTSLDRRVPIASAALATFLGSIAAVPPASQTIFLIGLPLAQVWLVRTTINHARSFEDVLRRIDEIERSVNALLGEDLLLFQSRHPSQGKATGGRTGVETVRTVYTSALLMLGACLYLASLSFEKRTLDFYAAACGLIAVHLTLSVFLLRRYRYLKVPSSGCRTGRWVPWARSLCGGGGGGRTKPARTRRGRRRRPTGTDPGGLSPSTSPSAAGTASDRQTAETGVDRTAVPSAPLRY